MRSLKDLMAELGFNKNAPEESQKAFIKHLISAANKADAARSNQIKCEISHKEQTKIKTKVQFSEEQLAFEFPEDKRVS